MAEGAADGFGAVDEFWENVRRRRGRLAGARRYGGGFNL